MTLRLPPKVRREPPPRLESEVESLYRGVRRVYEKILSEKPDLVVAPLLGAGPVWAMVEAVALEDGNASKLPRVAYPRLSRHFFAENYPECQGRGFDELVAGEVEASLSKVMPTLGEAPAVMLVDETNSFMTYESNYFHVKDYLAARAPKARLTAVALTSNKFLSTRGYRLHGEPVEVIAVERMITQDSARYLGAMRRDGDVIVVLQPEDKTLLNQLLEGIKAAHRKHEARQRQTLK